MSTWFSKPTIQSQAQKKSSDLGSILTDAQTIPDDLKAILDGARDPFSKVEQNVPGMSGASGRVASGSIWDTPTNQPCGFSKARYPINDRAFFSLSQEAFTKLIERGFSETEAKALVTNSYWEFILQSVTEHHAEGVDIVNVMSDTYLLFTMGAMPINLSLGGMLFTTKSQDFRLDFLTMYHLIFRGTKLVENNCALIFNVKDTVYRLKPLGIHLAETSESSDMTQFTMSAVAYSYNVRGVRG